MKQTAAEGDSAGSTKPSSIPRPPIVAVLGHIDHGKSTLLDYIRKTNTVEKEAGGITQHLGAYEVVHSPRGGAPRTITFLDTPGHEAFAGIRARGCTVADIAVLAVSGEEGVKPQTAEALEFIKKRNLPYVVAITKLDKPQADIPRAKQSLAERGIYVEGYGGDIPCVALSSKTGEGVPELLDMILLVADIKGITADPRAPLCGCLVESNVDPRRGVSATGIITSGVLKKESFVVAEDAFAPARRLLNSAGEPVNVAAAGSSVRISGWNKLPRMGVAFTAVATRREAERAAESFAEKNDTLRKKPERMGAPGAKEAKGTREKVEIPAIVKADAAGSLEALLHEIAKRETEKVRVAVLHKGIGGITESDIKIVRGAERPLIIGFNVPTDASARALIERDQCAAATFDVIYKLGEWLEGIISERTPKEMIRTVSGNARVLKVFSTEKDRQIIGGKVLDGELAVGNEFSVLRREAAIGKGKIRELQKMREKISSVAVGSEFGASVSVSIPIMPSDRIETFTILEK